MKQLPVAWAEANGRFTALFEALVISWLKEASISGVAELLHLSWTEAAGIQQRAVNRGLKRRKKQPLKQMNAERAAALLEIARKDAKERYAFYKYLADRP